MKNWKIPALITVLFASAAFAFAGGANATTDEDYVKAVGKEFNQAWDFPSSFYGRVKVEIQVTENGAILRKKSNNRQFNEEALRAANVALDSSVKPGLVFPIEFNRAIPEFQNRIPVRGADADK
jgi:hypothetical protein